MRTASPLISVAASRGVWLLRWLLVLLIAFDQFGSPLHRHRHDSGVDAVHLSLAGSSSTHTAHERDEQGDTIFHSNTAVRSEARLLGGSGAESPSTRLLVAVIWPAAALEPAALGLPLVAPATEAAPPLASWHELLPEGRAPPLRA